MKPRRFTFDLALDDARCPVAGDSLWTARRTYEITEVQPVDSTRWGNRWRLTVNPVGRRVGDGWRFDNGWTPQPGSRAWHSSTYGRGETPQAFFGQPWPPSPDDAPVLP